MIHKPVNHGKLTETIVNYLIKYVVSSFSPFLPPLSLNLSEALLQTLNSQKFQTFGQFWTTLLQQAQNNDGSAGAKAQQVWTTLVWQLC